MTAHRRTVNDHRRRFFGSARGEIAFLCECGDAGCSRAVVLRVSGFDRARGTGAPLLHPSHGSPPER